MRHSVSTSYMKEICKLTSNLKKELTFLLQLSTDVVSYKLKKVIVAISTNTSET